MTTELTVVKGDAMKRQPREARVFDRDGQEVFITLRCPHCNEAKPLKAFGLRRMSNGQIRNAPWCKACRGRPARVSEIDSATPAE